MDKFSQPPAPRQVDIFAARRDVILRTARVQALPDPLRQRLRRRYGGRFGLGAETLDGDDALAWLPARVLTQRPALAPPLTRAEPAQAGAAERGMRLLVELPGLDHRGSHHDLEPRRKALRHVCARLDDAHRATR